MIEGKLERNLKCRPDKSYARSLHATKLLLNPYLSSPAHSLIDTINTLFTCNKPYDTCVFNYPIARWSFVEYLSH